MADQQRLFKAKPVPDEHLSCCRLVSMFMFQPLSRASADCHHRILVRTSKVAGFLTTPRAKS
jgi:hypothetical protein